MDEIELAIETFARGFSFTRSFTFPCLAEREGPLWVLRDAPRRRGDYRTEEWVARGVAPVEVDRFVREKTRGKYALCAILDGDGSDPQIRAQYKAIGYRLRTTEPLMMHDLQRIPQCTSPAQVIRVSTPEMAQRLNKMAGARQLLPEHLDSDSPLRQYIAEIDGQIVGYVRSAMAGAATWCSSMFVAPAMRRRGIARSMLCQMLRDDRARAAKAAVLLASHTGALLYPVVGYRQIATLLLYSPKARSIQGANASR